MSTSRLEKFIYAICSMEVSDLPAPLSRIEILWNCLITGETPDFEPQSRNEQYLMAMLGLYELENLPTPMSRGEKLLYKIAMGETDLSDIPAYLSRYEELLGYLAENGGVGDFEYVLQTLNQRLSTLYSTKERPMKQAVIKGDTLVNELPRPSLKNTMINASSQKLNQGYDNRKTLVNIVKNPGDIKAIGKSSETLAKYEVTNLDSTKNYTILFELSDYNSDKGLTISLGITSTGITSNAINKNGIHKILFPSDKVGSNMNEIWFYWTVQNWTDGNSANIKNIVILEGDHTQEDIPYFEGTKTFSATPNVVDGEFKQAVVKGQTLVNIKGEETVETSNVNTHHDFLVPLVKKNTDYLIKYDTTISGGVLAVGFLKDDSFWSNNRENQPNTGLFKLNSGEYPNYFRIICQSDNIITINNLMIIEYQEGMENWDIPYFEGMQSVQLSEVTTTGKNLFNKENVVSGVFSSTFLTIRPNDKRLTIDKDNAIKVEPNTSYTFSFATGYKAGALGLNKNKTVYTIDSKWQTNSNGHTFTTDANTNYVIFNMAKANDSIIQPSDIDDMKMILEKGSVATPYEPYQSNTLTLAEPINLRKVGDVEDEFDALTGQVTERIGEIVFDGSEDETWDTDISNPNNYKFLIELPNINCNATSGMITEIVISDKFPSVNNADSSVGKDVESVCINGWANRKLNLSISKTKLTDMSVNSLRKYLSQNPFTVQYQLKMPTTKQVTPTITDQDGATQTKLHSFNDGYLSVSSQGLLPSAVNYEVPTNNSYYLPDMLTLGAQYTSRGSADCNATIDGKLLTLGKNRTFTTPSSVTDKLMVLDEAVDDLMFIKGDQTAKDFGYFEGMKSVVLSNKMPVLTTTGKNLLNPNYLKEQCLKISSSATYTDGNIVFHSGAFHKKRLIALDFEPNTQYAFNFKMSGKQGSQLHIKVYYTNNTDSSHIPYISDTTGIISGVTNANATVKYITISFGNGTSGCVLYVDECSLFKSNTVMPHEPFKSNILSTSEDVVLRGIGDVQSTLDCLTGEVIERIGEIVLDDTLYYEHSWGGSRDTETHYVIGAKVNNHLWNVNQDLGSSLIKCDKLITRGITSFNGFGYLLFYVSKSDLGEELTNAKIREYILSLNATAQYPLATPTIKTVDLTTVDQDGQPTKLKTYNDISYVEMNADNIIPSVDVEVATKISETLSTLGLDHHDISETQDQLGQTIDEQTENTDATMMATTEIYEQTL